MSFAEALESELTRDAADGEIRKHHLDPVEFFAQVGDRPWYTGAEVLAWLGY